MITLMVDVTCPLCDNGAEHVINHTPANGATALAVIGCECGAEFEVSAVLRKFGHRGTGQTWAALANLTDA